MALVADLRAGDSVAAAGEVGRLAPLIYFCYAYINKEGAEIKHKVTRLVVFLPVILILVFSVIASNRPKTAHAADNDFSNGITVDSTLDTPDANVGDNICDDGDGNCTLRAAIQEANSNADETTISFGIAPFDGSVKTIQPTVKLPEINEATIIDGYSQDDASENTQVAPLPVNTQLRIELDGSLLPDVNSGNITSCLYVVDADNTKISGLIINKCGGSGIDILRSDNTQVMGNFIGTDETGLLDEGNGRATHNGVGVYSIASNQVRIGGTEPADRNVIAGNQNQDIYWGNEGDDANGSGNNVVQGNFIGVGADGLTPLPAGWQNGKGNAVLMGNTHDDKIGGTESGAGNVIGSSYEYGISLRDGCTGTIIQGNYIGTDYTGLAPLIHNEGQGNISSGIHISTITGYSRASHDVLVGGTDPAARNIVSGNANNINPEFASGVVIDEDAYNVQVQNNYLGLGVDGITPVPNSGSGLHIGSSAHDVTAVNNVISGNEQMGVGLNTPTGSIDNIVLQGNFIGTDETGSLAVGNGKTGIGIISRVHNVTIGGSSAGQGNIIASNGNDGITLLDKTSSSISIRGNKIGTDVTGSQDLGNSYNGIVSGSDDVMIGGPNAADANIIAYNSQIGVVVQNAAMNNTILRNSIHDNSGMGIDLNWNGPTANDTLDPDSGSNNLLNYPEDITYEVSGGDTVIRYNLDVPAGSYRVEFFSNASADGSGYGEGQTFIGSQDVTSTGTGTQSFTRTVSGSSHANIVATATLINTNLPFDFGETSEFSAAATAYEPPPPVSDISLTKTLTNPNDIEIGAMANYHLVYKNNGPDDADLSGYVVGGNPFMYDYVPGEDLINAANYVADGPFPGTYFIDVNNPQVVCLYGGAPGASALGLTSDTSIGVVACWLAGGDTTLASGASLAIDLSFEVAPGSDLQFTNYAFALPAAGDPDTSMPLQLSRP